MNMIHTYINSIRISILIVFFPLVTGSGERLVNLTLPVKPNVMIRSCVDT